MIPSSLNAKALKAHSNYVRTSSDGIVWHICKYRVLYADTDRSQTVYHANYLHYFELGRTSLMRAAAYPYREIEASGYVYPIIEVGLNIYTPLHYDDQMRIYTRPSERERVKLRFDYIITTETTNTIVCEGFTRHCATNSAGIPVAVDEKTVKLWQNFPK